MYLNHSKLLKYLLFDWINYFIEYKDIEMEDIVFSVLNVAIFEAQGKYNYQDKIIIHLII